MFIKLKYCKLIFHFQHVIFVDQSQDVTLYGDISSKDDFESKSNQYNFKLEGIDWQDLKSNVDAILKEYFSTNKFIEILPSKADKGDV